METTTVCPYCGVALTFGAITFTCPCCGATVDIDDEVNHE